MKLNQELKLYCGTTLSNRLAKSAMSENMASKDHTPGDAFYNLYRRWALGGVGLCISGNVMIDKNHLGEPNNVILENDQHLDLFKKWAACTSGTKMALWMQLNHPGKQVPKFLSKKLVAPSAIPLDPGIRPMFATPRALTEKEILEIIHRFSHSAILAKTAGFHGVQIHAAHGYLINQFLSEKHNQRQDQWGGSLENRMRFLLEIYKAMREVVGTTFAIGVKINTADFQKGGFSHE
ncbi:MAG: NADH oxidase, partial [Bdellovibrionota bacterium]